MAVRVYFAWKGVLRRFGCKPGDISRKNHGKVKDAITLKV